MRKRKLFAVVVLLLITAACQVRNDVGTPAPTFGVEPTTQGDMTEAPEPSDESAAKNSAPVVLPGQSMEQVLGSAQALTEHLMNRVLHEGIVERGEGITDRELFYFFTTLPGYMQNQDHPYGDAVTLTPDSLYIFPEEAVRQAAYELFGFEDWAFGGSMMAYNADAGQYESGLEFGTGANRYRCSDLQAVYLADAGMVEVTFELERAATVNGDPGWEHLGQYIMWYQVFQEDGIFLRYEDIQKAK